MVALAVRYCGQKPVNCNSRPLLNQAFAAVERGDWIGAGVRLREAVRHFLTAEVEYHGAKISKRKVRQTPRAMLDALHRAEVCSEYYHQRITDAIDVGRAAHRPDDPDGIRRLRGALKRLLRSDGLQCITVIKIEPTDNTKSLPAKLHAPAQASDPDEELKR